MTVAWHPHSPPAISGAVGDESPAAAHGEHVEHIDCRNHPDPLEPLDALRQRLEAHINPTDLWDAANKQLRRGLRQQLLGDATPESREHQLVLAIGRAARLLPYPVIAVLHAVEQADPATLDVLQRAVHNPGWLRLPIQCLFSRLPRSGAALELAELLDLFERADPADRLDRDAPSAPDIGQWLAHHGLILRAASAVSHAGRFEAEEVAALLRIDHLDALEQLQGAVDAGFPLADDGAAGFRMPPEVAGALRTGLLPSLAAAWRAHMRSFEEPEAATTKPTPSPPPSPPQAHAQPRPSANTPQERALQQMLSAAHQAWQQDDVQRTSTLLQAAAQELQQIDGEVNSALAVGIYTDLAQLMWRSSGTSAGASLQVALAWAQRATDAAKDDTEPLIVAQALETFAAIAHDIGDPPTLRKAQQALTDAIRGLQAHGLERDAASLLNNQAAIVVRLGDPVRAAHLLRTSRDIFARQAGASARALRELAETDLLLARLPLHVPTAKGKRSAAIDAALDHAANAESAYRKLEMPLEVARVLETAGRLQAWAGRAESASESLIEALQAQHRLGDAVGLARTTDALARVLGGRSRHGEAMSLLQDSVSLNVSTGSPLGLAHNRRTLAALQRSFGTRSGLLGPIEAQITEAELHIGQTDVPPSVPDRL